MDCISPNGSPIYQLTCTTKGLNVATVTEDGILSICDLDQNRIVRRIEDPNGRIGCAAWSPSGEMIALGGGLGNNSLSIWDAASGERLLCDESWRGPIDSISWHPSGGALVSASRHGALWLWDLERSGETAELSMERDRIGGVDWSPDGNSICFASFGGAVRRIDLRRPEVTVAFAGHSAPVYDVSWSSDSKLVASASLDRTVSVWDAASGARRVVLEGHTSGVDYVSFLDQDKLLVSLSTSGDLLMWRTDNWAQVLYLRLGALGEPFPKVSAHSTLPIIILSSLDVLCALRVDSTRLWDSAEYENNSVFYVNAKAVLLGDSGVGKSGLGIRIAEGAFRHTEGSTHGAKFWHFHAHQLKSLPENLSAELTLWDLAGQPKPATR